jgi:hypothetical protein
MWALHLDKLATFSLILLALSWNSGAQQPSPSCQNPTLTVKPDEDLQQAIDQAPEGAVLQLAANADQRVSL